jgi:hypothetical protein
VARVSPWSVAPLLAAVVLGHAVAAHANPALHDGDLIFQTSRSDQSQAIQRATGSRFSHVGLLVTRDGQLVVLEAVGPVRYTRLEDFIRHGDGGHYVVRRLRDAATRLDAAALDQLHAAGHAYAGKPYDLQFRWNDERIYCSELVWKAYDHALHLHLGEPRPLRSYALGDPEVQRKLRERYGRDIPLDEPMISPQDVFDSPLLATVAEH